MKLNEVKQSPSWTREVPEEQLDKMLKQVKYRMEIIKSKVEALIADKSNGYECKQVGFGFVSKLGGGKMPDIRETVVTIQGHTIAYDIANTKVWTVTGDIEKFTPKFNYLNTMMSALSKKHSDIMAEVIRRGNEKRMKAKGLS